MAELTDPSQPTFEDEVHDLLLANYVLLRRLVDFEYIKLGRIDTALADKIAAKHEAGEYLYPEVFSDELPTQADAG